MPSGKDLGRKAGKSARDLRSRNAASALALNARKEIERQDQLQPSDLWFSPDQMYEGARYAFTYPFRHPEAVTEFGLSMAPGSGEAMSLRDAWNASGRGAAALRGGDYSQAASEYGNLTAALLGAIPGAGVIARGTKRGAAWMDRNLPEGFNRLLDVITPSDPKNTTFMFGGPTDKTIYDLGRPNISKTADEIANDNYDIVSFRPDVANNAEEMFSGGQRFIESGVQPSEDTWSSIDDLHAAYSRWAAANGVPSMPEGQFLTALSRAGYMPARMGGSTRFPLVIKE